jgi:hypothetical protein
MWYSIISSLIESFWYFDTGRTDCNVVPFNIYGKNSIWETIAFIERLLDLENVLKNKQLF